MRTRLRLCLVIVKCLLVALFALSAMFSVRVL
jgi:hypothetical protein